MSESNPPSAQESPPEFAGLLAQSLASHQRGDLSAAEAGYRTLLQATPTHADAWHLLGVAALQQGRLDEALSCIEAAIGYQPGNADYLVNLASVQQHQGGISIAIATLERALALNPNLAMAHNNLALLLQGTSLSAAEQHLRTAIQLGHAEARGNLGSLLSLQGQHDEALALLSEAQQNMPHHVDITYNLANAYARCGRTVEAIAAYQSVLALQPAHADSWNNLGLALGKLGQTTYACTALETAVALAPQRSAYHSNLIFHLDFVHGATTDQQQAERRRWWQRHIQPLHLSPPVYPNGRDGERTLRIGYVSADFRQHSAAFTFSPMLLHFDSARFEVYCYANQAEDDALSEAFRAHVAGWRNIAGLSDEAAAASIRADGIDLLVDLSAHSAGGRLGIFARRPAPIQLTGWGHANGTGMPEIDYLMTDPVTLPPAYEPHYAERFAYLPCALSYMPSCPLPDLGPPPALSKGFITFGCVNRLGKVSDTVLPVWAQLLQHLPTARLLIKAAELEDAGTGVQLLQRMAHAGIDPQRVMLRGRTSQVEHLASFAEIDIALDPFPHGGGVSTFDALWMGVPVLTLQGNTQVGRLAAGIVSAAGLADWVAGGEADYVQRACRHAADVATLALLRHELRARLASGPVGSPPHYAAAVEAVYRKLWNEWIQAA